MRLQTAAPLFFSLAVLAGCSRDDVYGQSDLSTNVAKAYEDCREDEIRFLAAKHNIQTAFAPCGSNHFADFSWSPDGINVYFRLTHGGHIMNGEEKTIATIPTVMPNGDVAWLSADLLVLPLPPAEGQTSQRLGLYNKASNVLDVSDLALGDPKEVQPFGVDNKVLMAAVGEDGERRPYVFDPATGTLERAFPFLSQPVTSLVYTPGANLLAWGSPDGVELVKADSGESVALYPGVKRASVHKEGRYVALELEGEPISPFDQRAWDEVSPEARERELKRREKWLERLPEWAPREVTPPEIHIVDLVKGERYRITAFYGERFEWYELRNYYASFILWGIEGKQLNRNVALTDLAERLRMAEKGEVPLGLERYGDGSASVATDPVEASPPPAAADPEAPAPP